MYPRTGPAWLARVAMACSAALGGWAQAGDTHSQEIIWQGTPHDALFSVAFNERVGYAVGAAGRILAWTAETGWQEEVNPNPLSLLGIATAAEHTVAVGQMGVALSRQNGNWKAVDSGTPERLFDVDVNATGQAIAVGAFGAVLASTNGGQQWQSVKPQWGGWFGDPDGRLGDFFEPSVYGVQIQADGTAFACGELSLIMHSTNGGQDWTRVHAGSSSSAGVSPTLSAIRIAESGLGFAVGQEGTVLRTRDGGQSWSSVDLGTHANLLAVDVSTQGEVVIAGMRAMFTSRDGGASWEQIRSADLDRGWYSEVAWTEQGALAVGHQGQILMLRLPRMLSMATDGE